MLSIPGVHPFFMWAGFILLVVFFLILDLGVFNKKKHTLSVKEAVIWTLVWFSMAMIFNGFIFFEFGKEPALQFFVGYLLEKSLSVDNLFVILLIFLSFKIEPIYQHKILFWGIVGALVMRGAMILIGAALIEKFAWILYIFGAFLVYSGVKIFVKQKEDEFDPHDNFIVKLVKRVVHVTRDHHDGKLIVKQDGKIVVTIFFVALMVIEVSDVSFALDSIPAIFGITKDPFIVFTSNIFAILGLRSLYFVILKVHDYFSYLHYGLGAILIFIGAKMLLENIVHIPILLSLGVVVLLLAVSMTASVLLAKKEASAVKKG